MKNFGTRSSILVGLCGAALMITSVGCSSSSSPTDGGGAGTTGTGGGSGGTTGTGGSGGAAAPALSYTFDSSIQGWAINVYHDTNSTNIGWELSPDAGIDAAMPPTLTQDATAGNPATPPGSLKLTATYTGYNQYIDIKVGVSNLNLTGKKVHAQVQLASATGGTFPGGAILETDTTAAYSYGGSSGVQLGTVGTWVPLTLDLATVTPQSGQTYDPTMVVQIGIQFYSGSAPTDGGTTLGPIEATFLIDTVQAL